MRRGRRRRDIFKDVEWLEMGGLGFGVYLGGEREESGLGFFDFCVFECFWEKDGGGCCFCSFEDFSCIVEVRKVRGIKVGR